MEVRGKHPWLFRRADTYYLRAKVPIDLVERLGKREIKFSLQTKDRKEAERRIHGEAAKVQARFDEARSSAPGPSHANLAPAELEALAQAVFRDRRRGSEHGHELMLSPEERLAEIEELEQQETFIWSGDDRDFSRCYGIALRELRTRRPSETPSQNTVIDLAKLLMRAELEIVRTRMRRLEGDFSGQVGDELFRYPPRSPDRHTPGEATVDRLALLCDREAWTAHLSRQMKPRQVNQYLSDLTHFATHVPTLADFKKPSLQCYIETELTQVSPNTVIRKFSAIRSYWAYLQAHERVPPAENPFAGLLLPKKRPRIHRSEWKPAEICSLWRAARARSDNVLADVVRIAAFTGSRIEAVCALSLDTIADDPEAGLTLRFSDKTAAGRREIPVHRALVPLVRRLMAEAADRDGYLIAAATRNQHAERSTGIGKRFGRLKTELGYGPEHVFHNIRRTVVGLLSKSGCPEAVAADIVGHERRSMTYGTYRDKTSIQDMRRWLEEALVYPDEEFASAR